MASTTILIMVMFQQRLLPFITPYIGLYGELVYVGLSSLVLTVMEVGKFLIKIPKSI